MSQPSSTAPTLGEEERKSCKCKTRRAKNNSRVRTFLSDHPLSVKTISYDPELLVRMALSTLARSGIKLTLKKTQQIYSAYLKDRNLSPTVVLLPNDAEKKEMIKEMLTRFFKL